MHTDKPTLIDVSHVVEHGIDYLQRLACPHYLRLSQPRSVQGTLCQGHDLSSGQERPTIRAPCNGRMLTADKQSQEAVGISDNTMACRWLPPASAPASRRLSAAPDAQHEV